MNRLRPGNTLLAALGLLAVCSAGLAVTTGTTMDKKDGSQITLTDKDNNSKQDLAPRALLVVHLETQPGTGFSWSVAKCNRDQLTLLSSVMLDNPSMLPGGKTVQVFTFRAAGAGVSDLELHYARPFEKDKPPAKTFKVAVTQQAGKQLTLSDKDNNTKQKLALGAVLVVHLETQPGTGFSWAIAKHDKDKLTLLSKVVLDNPDKTPGGKAMQVFTFRAMTAGASALELHYKRPFDKDKEPAKTFKVSLTIDQ